LLTPLREEDREAWLEKLVDVVQKQGLETTTVEKSHIEKAAKVISLTLPHNIILSKLLKFQECCQNEFDDSGTELLNVISSFDVPKFVYSSERKKYLPHDSKLSLFGQARDKAEMFRHRYAVLHQRTSRHSLFTPSILGAASSNSGASGSQKYQLKPIEYLLGMSSKLTNVVVLGMLTHLTEGKLYLEDTTGSVPVSLKDTVRII